MIRCEATGKLEGVCHGIDPSGIRQSSEAGEEIPGTVREPCAGGWAGMASGFDALAPWLCGSGFLTEVLWAAVQRHDQAIAVQ